MPTPEIYMAGWYSVTVHGSTAYRRSMTECVLWALDVQQQYCDTCQRTASTGNEDASHHTPEKALRVL